MSRITVVIPCYGQARFLPEALDSVRVQSCPEDEIIVVDDGTPDASVAAVVPGYAGVRYIRQANGGLAAARNRGLRESLGRYVLFLDADDRLLPGHFERSLRAFAEHPEAACVFGTYRCFGPGAYEIVHDCRPRPDHYATLLRNNFIGTLAGVLFDRTVLERLDGFRVDMPGCEDYELLLRVVREYPVFCHHQMVAEYRRYGDQMSSNLGLMLRTSIRALRLQRPYLRARADYPTAYWHGVRRCRLIYGEPLAWQTVAEARAGEWRAALKHGLLLAGYHPQGLLRLLQTTCQAAMRLRPRAQ